MIGVLAPHGFARAQSPVKVMPLGDSITNGFLAPNSYRAALCDKFPVRTIQFVGSRTNGVMPCGNAEEGHDGWFTKKSTVSQSDSNLYDHVGEWLTASTPDYVLLGIGTNDINYGITASEYQANLGALTERIFTLLPNVRLVVTTLPMMHTYTDSPQLRDLSAYNAAVRAVVVSGKAAGRALYLADVNGGGLVYPDDYVDPIHPNAAGGAKMAAKWYEALGPLVNGGGVQPVTSPAPTLAPTLTPSPVPTLAPTLSTQPSSRADLNHDGKVDIRDLSILLASWDKTGAGDIDSNGRVTVIDLSLLLSSWTS